MHGIRHFYCTHTHGPLVYVNLNCGTKLRERERGRKGERARESKRERQRERDSEREKERERERGRQRERERERETERDRARERLRERDRERGRLRERETERERERDSIVGWCDGGIKERGDFSSLSLPPPSVEGISLSPGLWRSNWELLRCKRASNAGFPPRWPLTREQNHFP